ncbi:MAG TPA: MqnA/MqnD/SBP family protein, partial [Vicinamibacteria bacterium]
SARLLRLVLEDRYGVRPRAYVRGARAEADAFLVIGNEALTQNYSPTPGFPHRYDLASEWWVWTGLPFVFALWTIRRSLPSNVKERFGDLLSRSFELGMSQVDEIAAEFAGELGPPEDLASYLRNFHYRLGPEEMQGLEEFRRRVLERDLLRPM